MTDEKVMPGDHGRRKANKQPAGHVQPDWWPNQAESQDTAPALPLSDPMGKDFDYARSSRARPWRP